MRDIKFRKDADSIYQLRQDLCHPGTRVELVYSGPFRMLGYDGWNIRIVAVESGRAWYSCYAFKSKRATEKPKARPYGLGSAKKVALALARDQHALQEIGILPPDGCYVLHSPRPPTPVSDHVQLSLW